MQKTRKLGRRSRSRFRFRFPDPVSGRRFPVAGFRIRFPAAGRRSPGAGPVTVTVIRDRNRNP
ncbi:hypothetical protein FIV42_08595 [Persicimonas caeni]|uniref:Uncharacterized protein n=1 Tax=Persicimonas caeni TaxID=2292766 RepID=A0A4Y6PSN9_PERCE|nr:hypothetical protein FIV42_08595 [Persicimonas caeni]QED32006.1 hypothetical protein FRD00_08590 [Persicimonas caeni]